MRWPEIEDFRKPTAQHGNDVMLVTKHWLANQEYKDVIALIPAGQADAICKFFQQAPGVTDRRLISEKVRKNIQAYAPRCKRSGDISGDAEAYLLAWSSGEAPQLPAPQNYSILSYTRPRAQPSAPPTNWAPPLRSRHISVLGEGETHGLSDSDSAGEDMPICMQ